MSKFQPGDRVRVVDYDLGPGLVKRNILGLLPMDSVHVVNNDGLVDGWLTEVGSYHVFELFLDEPAEEDSLTLRIASEKLEPTIPSFILPSLSDPLERERAVRTLGTRDIGRIAHMLSDWSDHPAPLAWARAEAMLDGFTLGRETVR